VRFLALVLLAVAPLVGQDALVNEGYDRFYNLEYEEAIAAFERAVALHPDIPDLHNHLAEALVFREMYRNGALESEMVSGNNSFLRRPKLNPSPETEKRFLNELAASMSLCEARLRANPNDAGALYAQGIAYGLRSNYYWVVKKAWRDALRDATAARQAHDRVVAIDPLNIDARLVDGLHDYIVGSLPLTFRLVGFLVGIHGDKERGIRTVEEVAAHGSLNRVEAEVFLGALYRRENQPRKAIPLVQDLIARFPRNFLLRLELSQMCSVAGDRQQAMDAAEEIARLKTRHAPGYDRVPWEAVYFQEGTIEFWYRDLDRALDHMQKVAAAADRVDLNTGVYAYLRMGQIYDMTQHRQQALEAYRKAIAYAPQAEAAEESRKYLAAPYRRM